jgi:CubicO group peptidase (beta-lactamase class C family)
MTVTDVQAAVQTRLDDLVSSGVERGLQAAAYLDGRLVVDAWAGVADADSGQQVDGDTLFTVFSTTKGVTSTVMHLLAERGVIDYDAPIATYWPEFAANGKERVTVRHALTHAAGIPQRPTSVPPTDWEGMCREIAALTPLWEPGTQHGYHAGTFGWILGETARRADGRPIQRIVAEEIARPLGLGDALFFGISDDAAPRVATLENDTSITNAPAAPADSLLARAMPNSREYYALYNRPEMRRAVQPSGGGIMSARALARHYAALVGDGVDGVRLLPPERVQTATALQTEAKDVVIGLPMRRGLGYMLGGPDSPMGARITAFGHAGYGGSIGFADPDYRFAFALTKNRLASTLPGQGAASFVASAVRAALGIPER